MVREFPNNPEQVLWIIAVIGAIGILIQSLEYLTQRAILRDSAALNWDLIKTQWTRREPPVFLAALLDSLLSYPNILYLLGLRAAAATLLILFVQVDTLRLLSIAYLYLSNILIYSIRLSNARLGSSGMMSLVFGALLLAQITPNPLVFEGALWFIALQACLAYSSNGLIKLGASAWRQGHALFLIANHQLYGLPALSHFLYNHPGLTKCLTWSALGMLILFPLVLIAGYPVAWFFIGWGVVFHILNSLIIGVNSFIWSFIATYPALIYVGFKIEAWF